jgi:hypothetical protein
VEDNRWPAVFFNAFCNADGSTPTYDAGGGDLRPLYATLTVSAPGEATQVVRVDPGQSVP